MVGEEHATIVELLRSRQGLVLELCRDRLGFSYPANAAIAELGADLTLVKPTERFADLVLSVGEAPELRAVVIVEVQMAEDRDKPFRWPLYVAATRDRFRCPVELVVVTTDEAVAKWAARPMRMSSTTSFRALVVGPSLVPMIEDPSVAHQHTELAVLSALAHKTASTAYAALDAIHSIPDERVLVYADTILACLGPSARRALEELVKTQDYEYRSDFARKYFSQGEAKGREEGRDAGRDEGLIKALHAVIASRGFRIDEVLSVRIESADSAQLESWIRKAVLAASVDEAFDD
jgi:hypothetical protein